MNKNELARAIQHARGCSMTGATELLDMFMRVLSEQLEQDRSINLQGFGVLSPWHQSSRLARNPRTGEAVTIAPRISVKFRPGKYLLDSLNKQK